MTTAERVHAQVTGGDAAEGPLYWSMTDELIGARTLEVASDAIEWGIVYGMTFALERQADPFEHDDDVARRAQTIAREVWERMSGAFPIELTSDNGVPA